MTDRVVNQLLTFLDGVEDRDDVRDGGHFSARFGGPRITTTGQARRSLCIVTSGEMERMAIFKPRREISFSGITETMCSWNVLERILFSQERTFR